MHTRWLQLLRSMEPVHSSAGCCSLLDIAIKPRERTATGAKAAPHLYSSIHQRALESRKRSVSQLPATAS